MCILYIYAQLGSIKKESGNRGLVGSRVLVLGARLVQGSIAFLFWEMFGASLGHVFGFQEQPYTPHRGDGKGLEDGFGAMGY